MTATRSTITSAPRGKANFATTRWSVVLRAGGDDAPAAAALAELCQSYWYPLYAYARRRGCDPEAARDAVQEFFLKLTTTRGFAGARRECGRFRSYLLVAMKRFLINEWQRARCEKRGGDQPVVSLDECLAESRYRLDLADNETAEVLFDRQWALTMLDRVLARLAEEYTAAGKADWFAELRGAIAADATTAPYAEIAARLGSSEGAIKVAVHRLRARYREILREEIAQTVATPDAVDEELHHLFAALRRS